MTFRCYAHADNTREYIITSDAKRINSYDFVVAFLCPGLVYTLVCVPSIHLLAFALQWLISGLYPKGCSVFILHLTGNYVDLLCCHCTLDYLADSRQTVHGHGRYPPYLALLDMSYPPTKRFLESPHNGALNSQIIPVETILVIRDVGVQVKTVYLGGRSSSRFIDRSKISDIIINEAITMMHIRVYMAIIVEGEDRMVVVFQVSSL